MKASIKLITSYKKTAKGYPIYVELIHLKRRRKEVIGHSEIEYWDSEKSLPIRHHPTYGLLITKVLEYKARIYKIYYNNFSFEEASRFLFSSTKTENNYFYEAGMDYSGNDKNGKLYKTVLNSFNSYFPYIETKEIEPWHAIKYMKSILEKNSANGVHTYMRTLNAIYNKLEPGENPFKGIRPKKERTVNKALSDHDIKKLITTRTLVSKFDGHNSYDTINYPRYYWMLMFYLGGIDFVDLASLRYDENVVGNRVQFNRRKGGTNVFINNKIFPEAKEIMSKFDCWPYLIPAFKYKDYSSYVGRVNDKLCGFTSDLNLSKKPLTKSARYTFITRAQRLLIDERITIEIVGHSQQSTHSIYTDQFPEDVRDKAHKKIISLNDR
jgi:hypothetical protein